MPILVFVLMLLVSVPAHASEKIKFGGTGSGLELMRKLGSLYVTQHPGIEIAVIPSLGSSGGIKALQVGALDLAISARPVKPEEKGLKSLLLCRTPLAFVVNSASAASAIRTDDLVQLYGTTAYTWPDGGRARVILRPEAEIDTKMLRSISPLVDLAVSQAKTRSGINMAATDQDNVKMLEATPGGFGMVALAMLTTAQTRLKILTFNGVEPSLRNLEQGRYPLVREYYLVTRNPANKTVNEIVSLAGSASGASLFKTLRCIPIERR